MKWLQPAILVCFASAASPTDAGRLLIDVEAKSIASVRVNDSVSQLRKRIGAANVTKATEGPRG